MSYAISQALQTAVFAALSADVTLSGLIGSNIYDAPPSGTLPETYILLGEEVVKPKGDMSVDGAVHEIYVSVFSSAAGFSAGKAVAVSVSDVLTDAALSLGRGQLSSLRFLKARARRGVPPNGRRVDLVFRAYVEDV